MNIDKGEDQYGWYADAKRVAMDGVRQRRSAEATYLRGVRPFSRLVSNRNGIAPFGVNSVGRQFLDEPESKGSLTGGIMFTKAGQQYIQKLLNDRQQQYAEQGATEPRYIPTSTTDVETGETALAIIYPQWDILLDDLRTFNVHSYESFNPWWASMLALLPTLGSNFRPQIKEIAGVLGGELRAWEDKYFGKFSKGSNLNQPLHYRDIVSKLNKAFIVITLYIGENPQTERDNYDWQDSEAYSNDIVDSVATETAVEQDIAAPVRRPWLEEQAYAPQVARNQLALYRGTDIGSAPIDLPTEDARRKAITLINKEKGYKVAQKTLNGIRQRLNMVVGSTIPGGVSADSLPSSVANQSVSDLIVARNRGELGPEMLVANTDHRGIFRNPHGSLRPVLVVVDGVSISDGVKLFLLLNYTIKLIVWFVITYCP
jgi:hypothetical protein